MVHSSLFAKAKVTDKQRIMSLQEGKNDEFGTGLSLLAWKKITEVVSELPESVSSEALDFLSVNKAI